MKVGFLNFWPDFDFENNFFINTLRSMYQNIEISKKPDYLFFSVFGDFDGVDSYDCVKIFYTGEPDWNYPVQKLKQKSDFSFSFDFSDDLNHFRLPFYVIQARGGPESILHDSGRDITAIKAQKKKFCAFVCTSEHCKERNNIFELLHKYKKVDSAGYWLNNVGYHLTRDPKFWIESKLSFIKDYMFVIAYENCSQEGYTSEKIFEPMQVNSIPIYWGNPKINLEFNSKSFVNRHMFDSDEEMLAYIHWICSDEKKWEEVISEPCYNDNIINLWAQKENIMGNFRRIFSK